MNVFDEGQAKTAGAGAVGRGLVALVAGQLGWRMAWRHLFLMRDGISARHPLRLRAPRDHDTSNLPEREVRNRYNTRSEMEFLRRGPGSAILRWCYAWAALLVIASAVALPSAPAAWAQSAGTNAIPGFWDPKRRVERPPATSVPAIRFVTTDDFPPFNFLNEDGRLTGFNVDLARAICDELQIRCTIQAREWDDTLNALRQGTADAIIAGLAITTAAREELDFSDVYMRWPGRFIVRRDAAPLELTPDGLKGKTLAVVARTAHEAYLAAFFPEVGRKLYPTPEAAREAVKSGDADAHFGDGMQLSFWLQSEAAGDCCMFLGGPYLESRFFGEGLAIAVPVGAENLKHALNAALAALQEKGVYAELYLRYFPVGFF